MISIIIIFIINHKGESWVLGIECGIKVMFKKTVNYPKQEKEMDEENLHCNICSNTVDKIDKMECLNPKCRTISHVICLRD